jgi:hypothetical protein
MKNICCGTPDGVRVESVHVFLLILMPYGQFGQSILSNPDVRRASISIENLTTTHSPNPVRGSTVNIFEKEIST